MASFKTRYYVRQDVPSTSTTPSCARCHEVEPKRSGRGWTNVCRAGKSGSCYWYRPYNQRSGTNRRYRTSVSAPSASETDDERERTQRVPRCEECGSVECKWATMGGSDAGVQLLGGARSNFDHALCTRNRIPRRVVIMADREYTLNRGDDLWNRLAFIGYQGSPRGSWRQRGKFGSRRSPRGREVSPSGRGEYNRRHRSQSPERSRSSRNTHAGYWSDSASARIELAQRGDVYGWMRRSRIFQNSGSSNASGGAERGTHRDSDPAGGGVAGESQHRTGVRSRRSEQGSGDSSGERDRQLRFQRAALVQQARVKPTSTGLNGQLLSVTFVNSTLAPVETPQQVAGSESESAEETASLPLAERFALGERINNMISQYYNVNIVVEPDLALVNRLTQQYTQGLSRDSAEVALCIRLLQAAVFAERNFRARNAQQTGHGGAAETPETITGAVDARPTGRPGARVAAVTRVVATPEVNAERVAPLPVVNPQVLPGGVGPEGRPNTPEPVVPQAPPMPAQPAIPAPPPMPPPVWMNVALMRTAVFVARLLGYGPAAPAIAGAAPLTVEELNTARSVPLIRGDAVHGEIEAARTTEANALRNRPRYREPSTIVTQNIKSPESGNDYPVFVSLPITAEREPTKNFVQKLVEKLSRPESFVYDFHIASLITQELAFKPRNAKTLMTAVQYGRRLINEYDKRLLTAAEETNIVLGSAVHAWLITDEEAKFRRIINHPLHTARIAEYNNMLSC